MFASLVSSKTFSLECANNVIAIVKHAHKQADVILVLKDLSWESEDASDARKPSSSIWILVLNVGLNMNSVKRAIYLHV